MRFLQRRKGRRTKATPCLQLRRETNSALSTQQYGHMYNSRPQPALQRAELFTAQRGADAASEPQAPDKAAELWCTALPR